MKKIANNTARNPEPLSLLVTPQKPTFAMDATIPSRQPQNPPPPKEVRKAPAWPSRSVKVRYVAQP